MLFKISYKLILFLIFLSIKGYSQNTVLIKGEIVGTNRNPVENANIIVQKTNYSTISDKKGKFEISLPSNQKFTIEISHVNYKKTYKKISSNSNQTLNFKLKNKVLKTMEVEYKDPGSSPTEILPKINAANISIPSSNIEGLLSSIGYGVRQNNELSSGFNVRGGNFDENLIYVNGIEVYRPFLARSGQQEGLSFINPTMVDNILFSAGGFEAKYGDKMSSVLDIKYKKPIKNKASVKLGLLGGSAHFEGLNNNGRFSYILGVRNKSNQYLLNSLDTEADYQPRFTDIQTLLNYQLNTNWDISFLANISSNEYKMIPNDRETEFGTVNEALKLRVYFEGQELDRYETYFGAISSKYQPNTKLNLQFTGSIFKTFEQENFDIIGEYWLYQLDNNLGSEDFGDIAFDRGIGKYIKHARNSLNATVSNLSHYGSYNNESTSFLWGLKLQKEEIDDYISEWKLIDSAFFNFPHPNDNIGGDSDANQEIILNELLKTQINLVSYRNSGYIQIAKDIRNISLKAGTRGSYWSFNEEFIMSPRLSLAYAPYWEKDIVFRAASGIYYQSPFYRELRDLEGNLNYEIEAQKSTHFVVGSDYLFYRWGRPFKLVSEIYYKDLQNLIPYKVENVQIKYLAENNSNGFATGVDLKINGEFVPGVESWASLSIMKTMEDIEGDFYLDELTGDSIYPGFIPRPTDQRINFSMFFQDYLPGNPNYKMHLSMIYGTGLPFGPPKAEKYQDILKMPDYRRVDIGFSAVLKTENKKSRIPFLNKLNNMWISTEVFNLLDIDNTVSYLWVADVSGRQYAVPNYLTPRQINFKLIIGI